MDLLRSFATIVETGSFTRAAEVQLRTQSAISLQMKRLEETLGCRLFERGGRGVEATEAGLLLLGYARRILGANDELVGLMAEPLVAGHVKVAAPEDMVAGHLAPALGRFLRAFSQVSAEVRCGMPANGWEPDVWLEDASAGDPAILLSESLHWVAAEGTSAAPVARGATVPLVTDLSTAPGSPHQIAVAALDRSGIDWRIALAAPAREAVLAAVAAGLGVTVAPRMALMPGLHVLSPMSGLPPLPPRVVAVRVRDDAPPVAGRLADFLREVMAGSN